MKSDLQSSLLLHRLADEVKEGGLIPIQDGLHIAIVHVDKEVARKLLKEVSAVSAKLLCHFHIWIWSLFLWVGCCRRFIVKKA